MFYLGNKNQIKINFNAIIILFSRIYRWFYRAQVSNYTHVIWVCLLVCVSTPSYSEIYGWVDKKGKTHYGDKPIQGIGQKNIELNTYQTKWEKFVISINDINNILTKQEKKRIVRDVNAVYQFFDRKLYFDIHKTVPVKIRIFEKRKDYLHYLSNKINASRIVKNSRGMYLSRLNEMVLVLNLKERWRTFETIKHETSHAITDAITPFVPAWLNEGLAENMESLGISQNRLFLYSHNENYSSLNRALNRGFKFDIKQFLSTSSNQFYSQMENPLNPNQAFTGELVRMLLSTELGRSFLVQLIHTYERGKRTYSSNLVNKYYIGGISKLQNNWNTWLTRPVSRQFEI